MTEVTKEQKVLEGRGGGKAGGRYRKECRNDQEKDDKDKLYKKKSVNKKVKE